MFLDFTRAQSVHHRRVGTEIFVHHQAWCRTNRSDAQPNNTEEDIHPASSNSNATGTNDILSKYTEDETVTL